MEQPPHVPLSLHDGHPWQLPNDPPLVGIFLQSPLVFLVKQCGLPNHIHTFRCDSSYDPLHDGHPWQ